MPARSRFVMRIVSLLPSATEIVAALGGVERLVGVTHACDHPPVIGSRARVTACAVDTSAAPGTVDSRVRAITAAGSPLYTLDEDLIRALRPDLILTQALCAVCAVMEADVRAFASRLSPSPEVLALSATSLDAVFDDIARVARAIGLVDEGDELLAGLHARMRAVHDTLRATEAPRPRVAMLEWSDPVYAGGHWVPGMIRRAGGVDVLAVAGDHSKIVSADSVAVALPEIVLVAPCGYDLPRAAAEAERLMRRPEWRSIAERSVSVWALDANGLTSRPGPRLIDGIEVMARIFHPTLFSLLDPAHAIRAAG